VDWSAQNYRHDHQKLLAWSISIQFRAARYISCYIFRGQAHFSTTQHLFEPKGKQILLMFVTSAVTFHERCAPSHRTVDSILKGEALSLIN
jgi:hypothetical protein